MDHPDFNITLEYQQLDDAILCQGAINALTFFTIKLDLEETEFLIHVEGFQDPESFMYIHAFLSMVMGIKRYLGPRIHEPEHVRALHLDLLVNITLGIDESGMWIATKERFSAVMNVAMQEAAEIYGSIKQDFD